MVPDRSRLLAAVLALSMGLMAELAGQDAPRGQQVPSFRTRVTAVPVEVRVVDKDGRPITDLTKEDFTILENGVAQQVAHFYPQILSAGAPAANMRARGEAPVFDASPQSQRTFLILLGTRALGDVERHPETLDGLVRFVRDRLLPQDQVGLLAPPESPGTYNRVADFSADHENLLAFLETFRRSPRRPSSSRESNPRDARQQSAATSPPAIDKLPAVKRDLGFEEYVRAWGKKPIGTELDYLFYAIKYLRYLPGEKHLIFVTERGPNPTWDQAKYLISLASDARVALDTIQIGEWVSGMNLPRLFGDAPDPTPQPRADTIQQPEGRRDRSLEGGAPTSTRSGGNLPAPAPADVQQRAIIAMRQYLGIYDLRYIAGQTGGQATMMKRADVALDRIDTATRAYYLLAYYPSGDAWDGKFRSIKVLVNRPGATVLFRHGYYANRDADTLDRQRVVSNARIESAGSQVADIHDIDVRMTATFVKATQGPGGEVTASLSIDVTRLSWTTDPDGMHVAHIEIGVYCADNGDNLIGDVRRMLTITSTDATYDRIMKERFARNIVVPVKKTPRLAKAVVYDYEADLVGTALVKVAR